MKYLELQQRVRQNIFSFSDVEKYFPTENAHALRTQLSRFVKRGLLKQIKRGLYCFKQETIDELALANILYRPSYISLESALNYYGIIPDVPQAVTSVSPTTSKRLKSDYGIFYYSKIKKELFFGFTKISIPVSARFVQLALKEKALLDYFYIRKIKNIEELRLDIQDLDITRYKKYAASFPNWVQTIKL
jgi:predicted transcriptional regulator of viral defense system